jgi:hypothetical protein
MMEGFKQQSAQNANSELSKTSPLLNQSRQTPEFLAYKAKHLGAFKGAAGVRSENVVPDQPGYQSYHTTYSSKNPNYYTSRAKPQTQATKRPVLADQPPVRKDSLQQARPATKENLVSRPAPIQTQVYNSQP